MQSSSKAVISEEVRVRMAPSPTGYLHLGGARTTLFNFLFARKNKGKFILRIEDTDEERSELNYEDAILNTVTWLGLAWDEGPVIGDRNKYKGNLGPYRQSQRKDIYREYIEKLLDEGNAYFCFCSKEELEKHKEYLLSQGQPPVYSNTCRDLKKEETEKLLAEGKPYIIRFKTPAKKLVFNDLVRGKVEFDTSLIGDIAIAKDKDTPLYNLAAAIDDYEMKITHVIRGEEHLPNTPKQILLQEALGLSTPKYAHISLILAPDKSKLSKRHGAISVEDFKKDGYLPEAIINFLSFLGWNPGTDREIYSLPSLIKDFSLERCQKGGAVFNSKRLDWINGFYIRQRSSEKLTELCLPYLAEEGFIEELENNGRKVNSSGKSEELKLFEEKERKFKIKETGEIVDFDWIQKTIIIYQERLKKLSEIKELVDFFYLENISYEKDLLRWKEMTDIEIKESLEVLESILSGIEKEKFNKESLEKVVMPEAEKTKDRGRLLWPFRVALTGKKASAGPFEIAEILGKEKTLKRIKESNKLF